MTPEEHCRHKTLYFVSGSYYLFCRECNICWATLGPDVYVNPLLEGEERIAVDVSYCDGTTRAAGTGRIVE